MDDNNEEFEDIFSSNSYEEIKEDISKIAEDFGIKSDLAKEFSNVVLSRYIINNLNKSNFENFNQVKKIKLEYTDNSNIEIELDDNLVINSIQESKNKIDINLHKNELNEYKFILTNKRDRTIETFVPDFFGFNLINKKSGLRSFNNDIILHDEILGIETRENNLYTDAFDTYSESKFEYNKYGRITSEKTFFKHEKSPLSLGYQDDYFFNKEYIEIHKYEYEHQYTYSVKYDERLDYLNNIENTDFE